MVKKKIKIKKKLVIKKVPKKTVKKHPGGRPTKYRTKFIGMIDEYLKGYKDSYYETRTEERLSPRGDIKKLKITVPKNIPSLYEFADIIGVVEETLWERSTRKKKDGSLVYSEFSNALRKIKHTQKKMLMDLSLRNDYNSTIAKLGLMVNHGMKEPPKDLNLGGQKDNPIQTEDKTKDISNLSRDQMEEYLRELYQDKE